MNFGSVFFPSSLTLPIAETQMAEDKYQSVQVNLQEEVAALKKEVLTLHGEVASLERRLKDTEKQKMDIVVRLAEVPGGTDYMLPI